MATPVTVFTFNAEQMEAAVRAEIGRSLSRALIRRYARAAIRAEIGTLTPAEVARFLKLPARANPERAAMRLMRKLGVEAIELTPKLIRYRVADIRALEERRARKLQISDCRFQIERRAA